MSWIYVTEPGAHLGKRGGYYVISREHETICEVPSATAEGAVIVDTVQVSSSVIVDFLKKGLPLTWLSTSGQFFGRLESTMNQNVLRQRDQFYLREDQEFLLALSRRIIFGKIYNQMTVLRRYQRSTDSQTIPQALNQIRAIANHLESAQSTEEIMGYEGSIARIYFHEIGRLPASRFRFEKRSKQPPKDPFNAMLSFGYTLLMYDFYTAISNSGLHPYVGFLHALKTGHPALASDLMEPWRAAVVDGLCLSLVSHHEIKEEHFQKNDETGGTYLDKIGRRIFIRAYERKMQSVNRYFKGGYSWRHTIQMACDAYSLAISRKDIDVLRPLIIR